MIEAPVTPYRREVGWIAQTPLASSRRRRLYLHVDRQVQEVEGRPAGPYARLELRGARGGARGFVTVSNRVGGPELLHVLEHRALTTGTVWKQRVGALGFRSIDLEPHVLEYLSPAEAVLELTLYGPNGAEQGRIVLDRDGRDALLRYVRAALEREPTAGERAVTS